MKANKTYISLKTAKLLKDCGIWSEFVWCENEANKYYIPTKPIIREKLNENAWNIPYPAFTWQEILWEYHEEFFSDRNFSYGAEYDYDWANGNFIVVRLLQLLQQKQYKEADKYFRDNCILIKKTK